MIELRQTEGSGHTLSRVLAERGRLNEARCRVIGAQVFTALRQLHQVGLVSGAINATNLLVMPDGRVLLDKTPEPNTIEPNGRCPKPNPEDLKPTDDLLSLAALVTFCATGIEIDPNISWSRPALASLGCSDALATDLANCFADPTNSEVCDALFTHKAIDVRNDLAPTIDFEPTTIPGLEPLQPATVALTQTTSQQAWPNSFWCKLVDFWNRLKH